MDVPSTRNQVPHPTSLHPPSGFFIAFGTAPSPPYHPAVRDLIDTSHPNAPALNAVKFSSSHHRSYIYRTPVADPTHSLNLLTEPQIAAVAICGVTIPGSLFDPFGLVPACELGLLSVDPQFSDLGLTSLLVEAHLLHVECLPRPQPAVAALPASEYPTDMLPGWVRLDTARDVSTDSDLDLYVFEA